MASKINNLATKALNGPVKAKGDADPVWHVQIAVAVALLLQLALPDRLVFGPRYIMPALEVILLGALVFATPRETVFESKLRRVAAIVMIALISLANAMSLQLLVHLLLTKGGIQGTELLKVSIQIYLTNIIIFGLWYWEMDGGGPGRRSHENKRKVDFLYPQMTSPDFSKKGWRPTFMDYLYVSATNATAFSPTDTMPLSQRAKLLMLFQALISLITIALVAARAVNILS